MSERAQHWDAVYRQKAADAVSWYRPHLEVSLALVEAAAGGREASIIDVGGGMATLVDDLLDRGCRHLHVLDISATALAGTRARLGERAAAVEWLVGDVVEFAFPAQHYDVWHDRAVFHFLTEATARAAYVDQVRRALRPGGCVVIATFAPDGPTRCSGLDVVRYGADDLRALFGDGFEQVRQEAELHRTPAGAMQSFVYAVLRRT